MQRVSWINECTKYRKSTIWLETIGHPYCSIHRIAAAGDLSLVKHCSKMPRKLQRWVLYLSMEQLLSPDAMVISPRCRLLSFSNIALIAESLFSTLLVFSKAADLLSLTTPRLIMLGASLMLSVLCDQHRGECLWPKDSLVTSRYKRVGHL